MIPTNSSDNSADDLSSEDMEKLADFDAEISPDEVKLLEEAVSTRERIHQHKLCLIALSSTSDMLKNFRRDTPDEFDAMLDMVDSFQAYAKELINLSQKAQYRMLVIGSLSEDELQP